MRDHILLWTESGHCSQADILPLRIRATIYAFSLMHQAIMKGRHHISSVGKETKVLTVWVICINSLAATPVFLPGEFHVQRSLAGYSPWGRKESDMTERLSLIHSLAER